MSAKPKGSLPAWTKRVVLWCGAATAVCGLALQAYAVVGFIRSRGAAEQKTADRLQAVEGAVNELKTDVTSLTGSFNELKGSIEGKAHTASLDSPRLVGPVRSE